MDMSKKDLNWLEEELNVYYVNFKGADHQSDYMKGVTTGLELALGLVEAIHRQDDVEADEEHILYFDGLMNSKNNHEEEPE